jgi:hypothetical protein
MAFKVKTRSIVAKADESIFDDKFSCDFIPEGCVLPEAPRAACGGEASSSFFILGQMNNGI